LDVSVLSVSSSPSGLAGVRLLAQSKHMLVANIGA
jgi:hypothetical protein